MRRSRSGHGSGLRLGVWGAAAALAAAPAAAWGYAATVSVDASQVTGAVSPKIFGQRFTYPGFYNGWPQFVTTQQDYVTHLGNWYTYMPIVWELRPTMMIWPGGHAFSLNFPWKKSIGRFEDRPLLTPLEQESQPDKKILLGVDEFMVVAEDFGAEPSITVPPLGRCGFGSCYGFPEDNADLIEYLNTPNDGSNPHFLGLAPDDPANVDWAARRAANGHPEPYGVRLVNIGSETRHDAQWTPAFYAQQFCDNCEAMRAIDPAIRCGAVGSDRPYYTDLFWNQPFARWSDWYEDVGEGIAADCGVAHLSYWQRNDYAPSHADAVTHGWALYKQGNEITNDVEIPADGDWTFRIFASGGDTPLNFPADLGLYADGVHRQTVTVQAPAYHEITIALTAGTHAIRLRKEDANEGAAFRVVVMPLVHVRNDATGAGFWYDTNYADALWDIVQSGHWIEHTYINEPAAFMQGAPSYQIEWGVGYSSPDVFQYDFEYPAVYGQTVRDMLNWAGFWHGFVERDIEVAFVFELFTDGWHGLIEGVSHDPLSGDEMGRPAETVRRRPTFWANKLYRDHILERKVAYDATGPTYLVGPTDGRVIGELGLVEDFQVPRLTALATASADGTEMALVVRNTHKSEDATVDFSIAGFAFEPSVRVQTLGGPDVYANNEPEPHSCSNPPGCEPEVAIVETVEAPGGANFQRTIPAHSIVAFKFTQLGADKAPPPVPAGFGGAIAPENDEVTLEWNAVAAPDFSGYRVYKARNAHGPYGRVVAEIPQGTTAYVDPGPFKMGASYSYAVTAVDTSGNESAKTASVVFSIPDETPPPGGGCAPPAAAPGTRAGAWGIVAAAATLVAAASRRRGSEGAGSGISRAEPFSRRP